MPQEGTADADIEEAKIAAELQYMAKVNKLLNMVKFNEIMADFSQDGRGSQSQIFKSWKFEELLALDKLVLSKKVFTMACTDENI